MKPSPTTATTPAGRLLATTLVVELKKKPGVWHDLELDEIAELLELSPRSYPRGDMSRELFYKLNEVCPSTRDGQGVSTTYDPTTRTNRVRYLPAVKVDPSKKTT